MSVSVYIHTHTPHAYTIRLKRKWLQRETCFCCVSNFLSVIITPPRIRVLLANHTGSPYHPSMRDAMGHAHWVQLRIFLLRSHM